MPECNICHDRGLILLDHKTARPCECMRQRLLERQLKASRITESFRAKTFENFHPDSSTPEVRSMWSSARHYVRQLEEGDLGENNWLVLLGVPGSGKTHLCMAVANRALKTGLTVAYIPHVEVMEELLAALKTSAGTHARTEEIKKADLLLWDDFLKGREAPIPWVMETIFLIVNYRYLHGLPTIISSERTPEEILAVDQATGSRILERARGHISIIEQPESNYRLHRG